MERSNKIPKIEEELTFPLNVYIINKMLNHLRRQIEHTKSINDNMDPFISPSELELAS